VWGALKYHGGTGHMGKIEWWVECVSAAGMRGPCSINVFVSLGCPDRMMRRVADRAVELSTIIGWLVRVAPNMSDKRAIVMFAWLHCKFASNCQMARCSISWRFQSGKSKVLVWAAKYPRMENSSRKSEFSTHSHENN
jgi:hypothetical protein